MILSKGKYRQGRIELERPIDVPDGTVVEVSIHADLDDDDWRGAGMARLAQEWDNDQDAVYDDWRRLYGVLQP